MRSTGIQAALLTLVVAGAAIVGGRAIATEESRLAMTESECLQALACRRAGPDTIAFEESTGSLFLRAAGDEAEDVWTESRDAAAAPSDIVRGTTYALEHPSAAVRILFHARTTTRKDARVGDTERAALGSMRAMASTSPLAFGRLAKIGAALRAGRDAEKWDLPPAPPAPEIVSLETP